MIVQRKPVVPKILYNKALIEHQVEKISLSCPIAFPPAYEPAASTGNIYDYISYEADWMQRLEASFSKDDSSSSLPVAINVDATHYHILRQHLRLLKQQFNFVLPQLVVAQQGADKLYTSLVAEQKSLEKAHVVVQDLEVVVARQNKEIEQMKLVNKAFLKSAYTQKNVVAELNDTISRLNGELVGECAAHSEKILELERELEIVKCNLTKKEDVALSLREAVEITNFNCEAELAKREEIISSLRRDLDRSTQKEHVANAGFAEKLAGHGVTMADLHNKAPQLTYSHEDPANVVAKKDLHVQELTEAHLQLKNIKAQYVDQLAAHEQKVHELQQEVAMCINQEFEMKTKLSEMLAQMEVDVRELQTRNITLDSANANLLNTIAEQKQILKIAQVENNSVQSIKARIIKELVEDREEVTGVLQEEVKRVHDKAQIFNRTNADVVLKVAEGESVVDSRFNDFTKSQLGTRATGNAMTDLQDTNTQPVEHQTDKVGHEAPIPPLFTAILPFTKWNKREPESNQ